MTTILDVLRTTWQRYKAGECQAEHLEAAIGDVVGGQLMCLLVETYSDNGVTFHVKGPFVSRKEAYLSAAGLKVGQGHCLPIGKPPDAVMPHSAQSGYVYCAHAKCFGIAIASSDDNGPQLCGECKDEDPDGDMNDCPHCETDNDEEAAVNAPEPNDGVDRRQSELLGPFPVPPPGHIYCGHMPCFGLMPTNYVGPRVCSTCRGNDPDGLREGCECCLTSAEAVAKEVR